MFTSNHDIARVINRIAGTGNGDGISKQGNVTTGNYADLEKSAMCVKLAELMLPGITWIYYGDEIGMVGNFPEGKDANSDYADLWYRQPMKWVAHGEKGDGSYTTDYYVTGSGQPVESDSVNSSDSVIPATVQETNANSDYSIMAKFAALKNANPAALVTGSFAETCDNNLNGTNQANSLCFTRSGGGSTYYVVVNFDRNPVSVNGDAAIKGKKVVATYNNSFAVDSTFSASSIPGYSVVVLK
jgi:glycosidase